MRGATYHVMSRGNRKAVIFEDDADRRRFARLLGEAAGRYRLLCHSYCLMGNHYHAVIECSDANLSAAIAAGSVPQSRLDDMVLRMSVVGARARAVARALRATPHR